MKITMIAILAMSLLAESASAEMLAIAGIVLYDDGSGNESTPLAGAKIGLYDFTDHDPLVSDVTDESGVFLLVVRSYDPFAERVKIGYRGSEYFGRPVELRPEAWSKASQVYAARCKYTLGPRAEDRTAGTPAEEAAYLRDLWSSLELQRDAGEIDGAAVRTQLAKEIRTLMSRNVDATELIAALESDETEGGRLAFMVAQSAESNGGAVVPEVYVAESDLQIEDGTLVGREVWEGEGVHAQWLVSGNERKTVEIMLCPESGENCIRKVEDLGAGAIRLNAKFPTLQPGDYDLTLFVNGEPRLDRELSVKSRRGYFPYDVGRAPEPDGL